MMGTINRNTMKAKKKKEAKCSTAHTGATIQLQRKMPVQMCRSSMENRTALPPGKKTWVFTILCYTLFIYYIALAKKLIFDVPQEVIVFVYSYSIQNLGSLISKHSPLPSHFSFTPSFASSVSQLTFLTSAHPLNMINCGQVLYVKPVRGTLYPTGTRQTSWDT